VPNYDVAVVGAGLGGLAVAALLSRRNQKTIVLESGETIDGAGGVFKRDGATFFAAPPLSYGFDPGGAFHELSEVLGGVHKVSVYSPSYQVALPDRRITLYPAWSDTLEELRREFPGEIDAIARFHRDLHKKAGRNAKNRVSSYLSKHRHAAGFLRKYRFSKELMTFFDVQSLFFFRKCAGDLSYASLIALCDTPPHYIEGGFNNLAEQLNGIILREGGEIRLNERISELVMEKNRVIGVKTKQGVVQAGTVLLNIAQRRPSSTLFIGLRREVIPIGMCNQVLFLPDYERPQDYFSLSLNEEEHADSPSGMRALCASFHSQQDIAFDKQTLTTQLQKIIPFMDDYLVFSEEHPFDDRGAALRESTSFKRLRSPEGNSLLFKGSRKNVFLLSNEHIAPLQVMSAAHRFVKKLE
jgi:hypothetical protein